MNFDSDTTQVFVSECLEYKAQLQRETIEIKTWKDLSAALETKHKVQIKWDVCRDKFCQMKEFFLSTLLPLEGYLSGKKWPYYDTFCDLYDIPCEYHSVIMCPTEDDNEEGDDQEEVPGKGGSLNYCLNFYKSFDVVSGLHLITPSILFQEVNFGRWLLWSYCWTSTRLRKRNLNPPNHSSSILSCFLKLPCNCMISQGTITLQSNVRTNSEG